MLSCCLAFLDLVKHNDVPEVALRIIDNASLGIIIKDARTWLA